MRRHAERIIQRGIDRAPAGRDLRAGLQPNENRPPWPELVSTPASEAIGVVAAS